MSTGLHKQRDDVAPTIVAREAPEGTLCVRCRRADSSLTRAH
jgi:hypothetical protein